MSETIKVYPFTLPFGFSAQPCPVCELHVTAGQQALNVANVTVHAACWERLAQPSEGG